MSKKTFIFYSLLNISNSINKDLAFVYNIDANIIQVYDNKNIKFFL